MWASILETPAAGSPSRSHDEYVDIRVQTEEDRARDWRPSEPPGDEKDAVPIAKAISKAMTQEVRLRVQQVAVEATALRNMLTVELASADAALANAHRNMHALASSRRLLLDELKAYRKRELEAQVQRGAVSERGVRHGSPPHAVSHMHHNAVHSAQAARVLELEQQLARATAWAFRLRREAHSATVELEVERERGLTLQQMLAESQQKALAESRAELSGLLEGRGAKPAPSVIRTVVEVPSPTERPSSRTSQSSPLLSERTGLNLE